jgi:hypothetical protein
LQEGLRSVAAHFNGFQELFRRKDNAQYLLVLLRDYDLETMERKSISEREHGRLIVRQSLIEAMLSQEEVVVNTNLEQQIEISSIALKNSAIKKQSPHTYSNHSLGASAYLLGVNLRKVNNEIVLTPELELFLRTGTLRDHTQLDILMQNYSKIMERVKQ